MKIRLATFFLLSIQLIVGGCNRVTSYEDCILRYVKEGMNQRAVEAVTIACDDKFASASDPGQAVRELTEAERSNLTGRASIRYGSRYGGTIYNGNPNVHITHLNIDVAGIYDGEEIVRTYSDYVQIAPLSTGDFSFDILTGDRDTRYRWSIRSARGRPIN